MRNEQVQLVTKVLRVEVLICWNRNTRDDVVDLIGPEVVIPKQDLGLLARLQCKSRVWSTDVRTCYRIDETKVLVSQREQLIEPVEVRVAGIVS